MFYALIALAYLLPVLCAGLFAFHSAGNWPLETRDRRRLIITWVAITLIAFLCQHYWIYVGATLGLLLVAGPKEPSIRIAFFAGLLFALPALQAEIPGLGPIKVLFPINYTRILILGLLFPLFLPNSRAGRRTPPFASPVDKFVILFLIIDIVVSTRISTPTEVIRLCAIYFIDYFAVYYIISRNVRSYEDVAKILTAVAFAGAAIAMVALLEEAKSWKVYLTVYNLLGMPMSQEVSFYDWRGGFLRTSVTAFYPMVLGCFLTLAMGAALGVQHHFKRSLWFYIFAGVIVLASFTTIARGAWIGLALLVCIHLLFKSRLKLFAMLLVGMCALVFMATSSNPAIRDIYELLPFTGSHNDHTIDYRIQLLDASIEVMKQYPWFGSPDYLETGELEYIRQGQGIIDIVNSYIQLGLRGGVVLIGSFALIFVYLLIRLSLILRHVQGPVRDMGIALIAMIVAFLFMIVTVSMVSMLPTMQWILVGLSTAFVQVHLNAMAGHGAPQRAPMHPGQPPMHPPRAPMPPRRSRTLSPRY